MPTWITPLKLKGAFLVIWDVASIVLAILGAYSIRLDYEPPTIFEWPVAGLVLWNLSILYFFDSYSFDPRLNPIQQAIRAVLAVLVAAIAGAAMLYAVEPPVSFTAFWQGNYSLTMILFLGLVGSSRYFLALHSIRWGRPECWLVVGNDKRGNHLWRRLKENENGFQRRFFVLTEQDLEKGVRLSFSGSKLIAMVSNKKAFEGGIEGIVINTMKPLSSMLTEDFVFLRFCGTQVLNSVEFFERSLSLIPISSDKELLPLLSEGFALQPDNLNWRLKRGLDIFLSLFLGIIVLPFIGVLAGLVRATSPGPAFFVQDRVGLRGEKFRLIKLRTMVWDDSVDVQKWAGENDDRVTKVGAVLRRLRLDEIPQLLNVLRGDMSLIGPRPEQPEIVKDLVKHIPFYEVRHLVKPGITGWAQVNYPYGASIEDALMKLEYDLYYMKHFSFLLDLFVSLKTLRVMSSRGGR